MMETVNYGAQNTINVLPLYSTHSKLHCRF